MIESSDLPRRWDPRTEACQSVLTTAGERRRAEVRHVGLVELLRGADGFSALVGSTPGEEVAVLEYLMAILYAAGHAPGDADEWQRWVEDRQSLAPAADWLAGQPDDHWDLFHPERPLGQNALLAPFMAEHGVGTAQLVIERAGDYNQFFDKVHLHDPEPMLPDAAFRAMLTQHAYGLGGRAMAKSDWLGPQLTYQAVGRLGTRIRVVATGPTLGDTLRLNLTPCERRRTGKRTGTFNYSWTDGRPGRRTFRARKVARQPDGPADLHSFLGRSILLRPVLVDGKVMVDRVLQAAGELLDPLPPMYLQDAVLEKARKDGKILPLRPSEDRMLWREAHAVYAATATASQDLTKGADLYDRLARLIDRRVDLVAVGLVSRQATATAWVSGTFPYVPGEEDKLKEAADEGLAICEYAAKALFAAASAARDATYPNPKPADKARLLKRFHAEPELWAGAADHFFALMSEVSCGISPGNGPLAEFGTEIRNLTWKVLADRLSSLPSNGRGMNARAQAEQRLKKRLTGSTCPAYLKEPPRA
ncbi:type I-E CRISPR-associated protein Cse1/CasA [Kitasatospora sp. NPDC058190]|uniref:type I-E CRISPR-associated protein Cse1/CasA n=1 Tax=Kitasatospora sp. NPDC058190 TaxID=3346371 RepID=UPI0036DB430E